jgi:hypothetical protein
MSYPSDVTATQWSLIEPHLPVSPGGLPHKTNLRDVVADVRLVEQVQAALQGSGEDDVVLRGDHQTGHDPSHAQPPGAQRAPKRTFNTIRSLEPLTGQSLNKAVETGPSSTKIVVAAAVPGDPERPAIEYGGWIAYIHTLNASNNHKDARGLTFREYDDEFRHLTNPSDGSTPVPISTKSQKHHGHHIIFKKSSEFDISNRGKAAEGRKYASDAKDILLYYGINPYWGKENLAFAQNFQHTLQSIKHMHKKLLDLHNGVDVDGAVPSAASITNMLKSFADAWVNHSLFGMQPNG